MRPDSGQPFLVESTRIIQDALEKISQTGYDAVVCWAEREEELVSVIRIRKDHPTLPIMVVSSQESPDFQGKVREAGATPFTGNTRLLEAIADHIRLSVQSGELHLAIRAQIQRALHQRKELRVVQEEYKQVTQLVGSLVPNTPTKPWIPLLVEDDPDQALLMIRAFYKAHVYAPLPIMKSGDEAIFYLAGVPPFDNRECYPLPSLVILDGHLPGKSGLEVLQWIRSNPDLKRLPVVMLSSSSDPDQINQAYQRGVNSYLVKPTQFDALVECVSRIESQWGAVSFLPEKELGTPAPRPPDPADFEAPRKSSPSPRRPSTGIRSLRPFKGPRSSEEVVPEERGLKPFPPRL